MQIPLGEYYNHLQLLEFAKSVWHLCAFCSVSACHSCCVRAGEIFFVDPSENVTAQLSDWLQRVEPQPDGDARTVADSDEYWEAVYRTLVQGRVPEAVAMLQRNKALDYAVGAARVLDRVCALLQQLPSLATVQQTLESFEGRLNEWRADVTELAEQKEVRDNPSLSRLAELLLGNEQVLSEAAASWHELLVGRLLFSKPQAMKVCVADCVC